MLRAFFRNPKYYAWAYGVGFTILASIYLQVQFTVMITEWYREFYDFIKQVATQATNQAPPGVT